MWPVVNVGGTCRTAEKKALKQFAGFIEIQAGAARMQLGQVAVADIAQKIGLDVTVGEVFLNEVVRTSHRAREKLVGPPFIKS